MEGLLTRKRQDAGVLLASCFFGDLQVPVVSSATFPYIFYTYKYFVIFSTGNKIKKQNEK